MKGEEAKKIWSQDQMLLINALHMFSVSYFTGSIKITTTEEPEGAPAKPPANGDGAVPVVKGRRAGRSPTAADPAGTETEIVAPKRPTCSPEQKVKVTNAINAYVWRPSVGERPLSRPAGGQPPAAQPRRRPHRPPAAPIDTFRHSRVESGAKLKPVRL